jgi:exodeoxyribonuclease VII large subunit
MFERSTNPGERKPFTVSELTRLIRMSLEEVFRSVTVRGEVSGVHVSQAGHVYFTLKDAAAQIRVVMWANNARRLKFRLEDGAELIVFGGLSVYEARGEYQIVASWIEPCGVGALQLAFEQLKAKLEREGLFDPAHKKPLPFLPRTIALVTSPTGAAIHDMLNIIGQRFPGMRVLVFPVKVQGEGAGEEIAAAIRYLNEAPPSAFGVPEIDVMIVGRGGGSLEDLWCFNEEAVARAIFASRIPVISAVGHETDVTISDLVADRRALTPSEAAQIVVPDRRELIAELEELGQRIDRTLSHAVKLARARMDALRDNKAFRRPFELLAQLSQRSDDSAVRLAAAMRMILAHANASLEASTAKLDALSPLRVLHRGYSITRNAADGRIVMDAAQLKNGDKIVTILDVGKAESVVTATEERMNGRTKEPTNSSTAETLSQPLSKNLVFFDKSFNQPPKTPKY